MSCACALSCITLFRMLKKLQQVNHGPEGNRKYWPHQSISQSVTNYFNAALRSFTKVENFVCYNFVCKFNNCLLD